MLLLHAVGPAANVPAPSSGLRGQPLRQVRGGTLVAWATSWLDERPPALGRDDLLAHHALVEQALALGACLPARFPTWLADEAALRGRLEARHAELCAAVERLRGRVELAVTARWTTPDPPTRQHAADGPSGPGHRYLQARRHAFQQSDRRRAEAQSVVDLVEDALGAALIEARHDRCPSERLALSSALLVPSERALELRDRIDQLSRGCENLRILVDGPWPPYSFAGLAAVSGGEG